MVRRLLRCALVVMVSCVAVAQTFAQVAGLLTSPDGKPVTGADVFVNHTTCYSTTDEEGYFSLNDVPLGYHELIAWKGGFTLYRQFMRVSKGQEYNLTLQFLSTEKVQKGKISAATDKTFKRALLGNDGLMNYLIGSQVIPEERDGKFRVLSGPVVIEFPSAGYRIIVFFSGTTYQDVSDAACLYQDIPVTNFNQKLEMEKVRQEMYKGSLRHWLRSMALATAASEGFRIDSNAVVTVSPDSINSLIRINSPRSFKLTYSGKVSTINSTNEIEANADGMLLNPGAVRVDGPIAKLGLTNKLPLDFRPVKDVETEFTEAMRYFYEKIYIHTDKLYYYAGETIWLKAYVNYYEREYRNSLSSVLHVELVAPNGEILSYRCLPIKDGTAYGDLPVPGQLAKGQYYLRSYTNLQRNFGEEGLFTRLVQVLDVKSFVKPDPTYKSPPDLGMEIRPEKDTYKVRDKITFFIQLDSGLTSANLSVAVTDAAQSIPVHQPTLPDIYDIAAKDIPTIKELTYRVETGVSFNGKFINNQDQGEKALITFFHFGTGNVMQVETESDGSFLQSGLQFPDSTQYSWKADKAKDKPYGKVIVQTRKAPALKMVAGPKLEIVEAGPTDEADPDMAKGNRLLNPVEVNDLRINPVPASVTQSRPFGKADYSLTSRQLNINAASLLLALVGKVPGLVVSPTQRVIFFRRAEGSSLLNSGLPLITLNDVPMGGDPYSILESLDFNNVESIEFHNRINSLYGTAGAYGVISVYTKSGEAAMAKADPTLQTIALPGFSEARVFSSPDYDNSGPTGPDHRSTLYWSPEIRTDFTTGMATVSFFASDLAGMYRVVVEGVTADGWPLRAETFVIVEDRN